MSRLTGAVAINPGFGPYKNLFEPTSSQYVPYWPPTARLSADIFLLLPFLNPRLLWLYHHIRITRQWRMDEAKPYLRWLTPVKKHCGFIAFDWLVDGRHACHVDGTTGPLGPTFACENGEPDFFSERVQHYIQSKRTVLFDSAAIFPKIPRDSVEAIRRFFVPKRQHRQAAEEWLGAVGSGADVLVGVAVRQGDFKTWLNGKNYVEPSLFAGVLRKFRDEMPDRRPLFVICSDDPISADQYPEVNAVSVPRGVMMHLCVLMACDYIVGTAESTFVQWASFLGNVPWLPVTTKGVDRPIDLGGLEVFGL